MQMIELVAVETGEVEMIDFGSESGRLNWEQWIIEQNEELVKQGCNAVDYRIVEADTSKCPDYEHDASYHATVCLINEWRWENLGQ